MKALPRLSRIGFAVAFATVTAYTPITSAQAPSAMQATKSFKFSITGKLNYLLFLPKGYADEPSKRWPLLVFLHGAGERGSDLQKVTVHGPPKLVKQRPDFPFIVVSPQCPEGRTWSKEPLAALVDEVLKKYAVDKSRVYLTGLSMGGYGTWELGLSYPEKFAAIVPICGGGKFITALLTTPERASAVKTLGIWAFHGAKDPVVPLSESERMVDLLKRRGVEEVKLTVYPEAMHDSWTETYNNPELYDWLLRHQRQPPAAKPPRADKKP